MMLRNCRIVSRLTDNVSYTQADIMVENEKIAAIAPAAGVCEAGDIDCTGLTVIPGLMDLHVHLVHDAAPESVGNAFSLYHTYAHRLGGFLDCGVTTVRDCGSVMRLGCYLRDGVNEGLFEGPHIIASGHIIAPEAMSSAAGGFGVHTIANGVDGVTLAARKEFAAGADFIKIYATQSMHQVHGQDPKCIYTPEEIRAMVRVAEMNNSYVAAHAHSTDAINMCLENGVRTIEHATYMDERSIELLLESRDRYVVLTHACSEPWHEGDGWNNPEEEAFWLRPDMVEGKRRCRAAEGRAYRRGIQIAVGTDLMPNDCGKYPYELMIRREYCGMSDIDILWQATAGSAKAAMLDDHTGMLRVGYDADLVAVKGNPDEDIAVLHEKPQLVMVSGTVRRNRIAK